MKFFYQNWTFENDDLPMTAFTYHNMSFHPHCHPEIELICMLSGTLTIGVNEEKRQVQEGDLVVCGSNDIHYFEQPDPETRALVIIFKPELLGALRTWPNEFHFATPYLTGTSSTGGIRDLMLSVQRELNEGKSPGSSMIIKGLLMQLCGLLHNTMPTLPRDREQPENRTRMQKILSYIEDNCCGELTLESVARHFRMDPYHFSRTFKATLGISFKTYLNTVRVSLAEIKLDTTEDSIMDIALECGFSSIRTFNRVYKSLKGHAPSDLRR